MIEPLSVCSGNKGCQQGVPGNTKADDVELEIKGQVKCDQDGHAQIEIMWLVDTEATKSIISTVTYNQHQQNIPLEKAGTRLTASNSGSNVKVLGKWSLTIVLNGYEYKHNFLIADVGEEGVLGKDFSKADRCYWKWELNTLESDW